MPLQLIDCIQTNRLCIRPVEQRDLADLFEMNSDDVVTHHLPYASWVNASDGEAWFARMQALAATGGAQQCVIEHVADGKVIGSLLLFKWDEGSARVEIGYVLNRTYWRQGYANEALYAACRHAFTALGVRRIEAEVNPANTASNATLRALGFKHEGLLRQRWTAKGTTYDTNIYGCLRDEWRAGAQ